MVQLLAKKLNIYRITVLFILMCSSNIAAEARSNY